MGRVVIHMFKLLSAVPARPDMRPTPAQVFVPVMPDANVNRDVMADKKNLDYVYESAKASLMGGLVRAIRTKADDDMAKEVFHWGLMVGQQGIAAGVMPTGLGNWDFSLNP